MVVDCLSEQQHALRCTAQTELGALGDPGEEAHLQPVFRVTVSVAPVRALGWQHSSQATNPTRERCSQSVDVFVGVFVVAGIAAGIAAEAHSTQLASRYTNTVLLFSGKYPA